MPDPALRSQVTGRGEPVLMIHGIISDGSFFDGAAGILSDTYSVITYDRRGYGASQAPADGDYSVAAQAEDAARVLREHAHAPAWILGNSAGGLIAVELCLRHPELVRGLVLLEPSLVYDDSSRETMLAWNRELNDYVARRRIKLALPAFSRVIGGGGEGGGSLAEMKQTYANLNSFMHGELNEVQHYCPPLEAVRNISVPVRVIVTEEGSGSIFGTTSAAGAEIIGWQTAAVPGRHNAVKDMPDAFALRFRHILEDMKHAN